MKRVEELEVKVAYLEHTLAELDEVIRNLMDRSDRLTHEVESLRQQVQAQAPAHLDEKPPHYS